MSAAEFESLVALFLEGNASAEQVARLRAALSASPSLRARFQASARLHKAQLACLSHREESSTAGVMTWLHAYGQRMGRSFAHLCLLALVFVELQVTIPAEYSGLLAYVESPSFSASPSVGNPESPAPAILEEKVEAVFSTGDYSPEDEMPLLASPLTPMPVGMPEMSMPSEVPADVEV
jgi:hypothetical protein